MAGSEEVEEYLAELEAGSGVRFRRLLHICTRVFGEPRTRGSHHIFKTPWPGDPRVNIQPGKGGAAKPYQVRQVVAALQCRFDQLE